MGFLETLIALILAVVGALTGSQPENPCYEDEVKVIVVGEVQPDNGLSPDVDWGIGPNFGTTLCVNADDHGLGK